MRRYARAAFLLATLGSTIVVGGCDAVRSSPSSGAAASSDTCTRCHGDPARNAAPPRSVRGATETSDVGVGAHQAHLTDGAIRQAIACGECHVVPSSVDSPGHMDGARAPVTFGALATTGGARPSWDTNQLSCSATYCHGATLGAGGTSQAPIWTKVDGTQAACGTCHGIPPTSAGHPAVSGGAGACSACHPQTVKADGSIDVSGGKHIDGTAQVGGFACTTCHGDAQRAPAAIAPAPPSDTKGNTATTAMGVGAHQAHLAGSALSNPIACGECHVVPSDAAHASQPVNVTFGALARSGSATPVWTPASASCASTYCHGATIGGGSNKAPVWTKVDGTQAACGSCHGTPPPAPHAQDTSCGSCHNGYTSTSVNAATHVNGAVEVASTTCTSCHGDAGRTAVAGADANVRAAPPVDTLGNTAATARGVGAHQAHVNKGSGALSRPTACSECHVVPGSTSHSNGAVDVAFGTRAKTGGASPSWNGTGCSASYCHGNFGGGAQAAPRWTGGSSQATCGSCHSNNPTTNRHPAASGSPHRNVSCTACHGTGYSTSTVNATLHVNGTKDLSASSGWDPSARSCAASCHGGESHRW